MAGTEKNSFGNIIDWNKTLDFHRRMITRYENDISFPRTKDSYQKIAEYFRVDVNYYSFYSY